MKANPFLSNDSIFSKGPKKTTVSEYTNAADCHNNSYVGGPTNVPSSAYSINYQQQTQVTHKTSTTPITSPLMAGYSDHSSNGQYSNGQGAQFQNYSRVDSRSYSNYEPSNYPTSYSKNSETFYNDNIPATVNRERAVTLNMGNIQELSLRNDMYSQPERSVQNRPIIQTKNATRHFEDPNEFIDINMNALTACLSNSQNRDEICRLIGLPTPNTSHNTTSQGFSSPLHQQTAGLAMLHHQSSHQQLYQQQLILQSKHQQQIAVFCKQKTVPQQPTTNQSKPSIVHNVPPQYIQQSTNIYANVISPLQSQQNVSETTSQQPVPTKKKPSQQANWSTPNQQKKLKTQPRKLESPLNYQSDEQEQFDFNENREEDNQNDFNNQFSKRLTTQGNPNQHHRGNNVYCVIKIEPEIDSTISLKASLQRQIASCTTKDGVRLFLTVGEQIQARRYLLR